MRNRFGFSDGERFIARGAHTAWLAAFVSESLLGDTLVIFFEHRALLDDDHCRLHARLSPRVYMTPRLWGTDTSALQHFYHEHFMVRTPVAAAASLRPALEPGAW